MEGFKKLSETQLVNDVNEDASVLVEDSGEIKRVPKLKIGAQSDWNETNENSPAFILNKPTQLGGGGIGISKFFLSYEHNCLVHVKDPETWITPGTEVTFNIPDDVVDFYEFRDIFTNSLCLVNRIVDYDSINTVNMSVVVHFSPYNDKDMYGWIKLGETNSVNMINFRGYFE